MAGQLTIDTLKASSGVLATQNGMTGICKAWVYFGYISSVQTTVNSFNVSSVTRNSAGNYTVNFTTAMPNANYCVTTGAISFSSGDTGGGDNMHVANTGSNWTTGSPVVSTTSATLFFGAGGTFLDALALYAVFHGN